MRFHHFGSLLLLAILRPVLGQDAQDFGTCKATNGRAGECISTSQCKTRGGTSDPANLCPGNQSIQCCTYGTCKNGAGICQPTSTCTGTSDPANLCPGPQHIQCCTPGGGGTPPPGGLLPGLNAQQSKHARAIILVARNQAVGNRGCQVSMVTALQESSIRVLANSNVPESFNYPHDGVGKDHDSVGIFQQRPKFWGTVKDCMDPTASAGKFFAALKKVSGWQSMGIGRAAQAVQKSAFPGAYDKHIPAAEKICAAAGI